MALGDLQTRRERYFALSLEIGYLGNAQRRLPLGAPAMKRGWGAILPSRLARRMSSFDALCSPQSKALFVEQQRSYDYGFVVSNSDFLRYHVYRALPESERQTVMHD